MFSRKSHMLDRLFYPKGVAVVGASPQGGSMAQGNNYIKGSIVQNFSGKIYPVHPDAQDTLGFKSYPTVRDIPDEVDLAIFTIPASAVLKVMEDCVAKGVKFVHLFTAGFSETGRAENAEIEKKLIDLAKKGGVRVIGPNCMGIYCPDGGLAFQPFLPYAPGSVGFFSQSGQLAGYFIMKGSKKGLRFSKVVSFGNASDLKAHDFLEYLAHDKKTEVIGSYLEGLKDGREFFKVAKIVTRKKPLVVYKGGQTEGGSRATASHTAAIAGSYRLWKGLCRQVGIIPVDSLDEMVCTLSALQNLPLPQGNNAAILGGAGGGSVTMTDMAEKAGLKVPHLSEKSIHELEKIIPPQGTSVKNPLDLGRDFFFKDKLLKLMHLLREDPKIQALIFLQQIGMFNRFMGRPSVNLLIEQTLKVKDELKKPMFLVLEKDDAFGGEDLLKEAEERYRAAGLVTFPGFELAAKTLLTLSNYYTFLSSSA